MFPLARVPFWVPIFDPQPNVARDAGHESPPNCSEMGFGCASHFPLSTNLRRVLGPSKVNP